ncbi:MAG: hypothetical protein HZA15_01850 [Nitrospirae bacterium]|nr:hypothetical protein [Nitrospirota bacterium]
MNLRLISLCLIILFVSACGAKQAVKPDETNVVPPQAEELKLPEVVPPVAVKDEKEEKKKAEKAAAEKKQDEQYVMLNFENADIETVVSTISDMLKINYILAPGVSGKITIQSHNKIPVSELYSTFQTVLEFNGFTAVKEGSFYRIVPIDTAKQQPVQIQMGKKPAPPKDSSFVTQEIPLEYVKASDVANLVRNLMPKGTDIIVYEPSNMLILTAPPSGILKFLKLLEAIDIPSTERDNSRTFIYYVENGEAKKLAEVLKTLYGKKTTTGTPATVRPAQPQQPAQPTLSRTTPRPGTMTTPATGATVQSETFAAELEGDIEIAAYDEINALIIKSSPRAYLVLLETLKKLDVQAKQVLIEVLIAEISLNDSTSLGLEWLLKGRSHINDQNFDFVTGNAQKPENLFKKGTTSELDFSQFAPIVTGGLFANIIDPKQFNILINAAATMGNVNVLASPHILALDNKEAKIEIGDEVPVATSVTQVGDSTVNGPTSQVQFKSVGTILTVTPHINEKKQVTLKISQEVSEVGDTVKIGGQDYTGFKTRKANTTGIVQDGHTLLIGGIIQERNITSRSGIPILSKIPILGYLFGTTTDTVAKRELILLITPHVVANHEEADQLTEDYKNKIKEVKKKIDEKKRQADIHLHEHEEGIKTD